MSYSRGLKISRHLFTFKFNFRGTTSTVSGLSESEVAEDEVIELDDEADGASSKPAKKKRKFEKADKEEIFVLHAVGVMNDFLCKTNSKVRASRVHVRVNFDEGAATLKANCKCVFCDSWYACNLTKYHSTSASSWKRHLSEKHLNKDLEYIDNKQKKINEMWKPGSSKGVGSSSVLTVAEDTSSVAEAESECESSGTK